MHKIVPALTLTLFLTGFALADSAAAITCPSGYQNYGSNCVKVGNTGESVNISANKQESAPKKKNNPGGSSASNSGSKSSTTTRDVSVGSGSVQQCGNGCKIIILHRGGKQVIVVYDPLPPRENPSAAAQKKVTLSDIANFKPDAPIQSADPFPIAFDSHPVNFWSDAVSHIVTGRLLGESAEVRFIPETFHWNFDDGATLNSNSPGKARKLEDFAKATATSHVFTRLGNHTITHSVTYRAQYRIAGGNWMAVEGDLKVPGNALNLHVASPKSLLVKN